METSKHRYRGPSTVLQSYMTEFAVVCPRCSRDALVRVNNPWILDGGKLTCSNCSHIESAEELTRYDVVVKRNCDYCGKEFEATLSGRKHKKEAITLRCPHCATSRRYQPRNIKHCLPDKDSGRACDPVFGYALWFQTAIRGDLFWAFNRRHLTDIRNYVQSRLRERRMTGHMTMVERLPAFIKSAKNRDAILKAISQWD